MYAIARVPSNPPNKPRSPGLLFSNTLRGGLFLASTTGGSHNVFMRGLLGILVAVAVAWAIYHFYFKSMPTTDVGTAPTQAISLTGVRSDLLQIAQAERSYVVLNGRCASLSELISSNSLSVARTERDGYTYSVDCSGNEFRATARHLPAPEGSPIRYPNLALDTNMQVGELH